MTVEMIKTTNVHLGKISYNCI